MVGLLWQRDRDDESLDTTLTRACQRYAARFGRWPTVAFVPEGSAADSVVLAVGGKQYTVELRPTRRVPANHVLVGIEGHDPSAPPTSRRGAGEKRAATTGAGGEPAATSGAGEKRAATSGAGEKRGATSGARRKRASTTTGEAQAASPQAEAVEEPKRRPVKRRSTMGWDPATARDAATDDHEAEQLSLWQTARRDDPAERE